MVSKAFLQRTPQNGRNSSVKGSGGGADKRSALVGMGCDYRINRLVVREKLPGDQTGEVRGRVEREAGVKKNGMHAKALWNCYLG